MNPTPRSLWGLSLAVLIACAGTANRGAADETQAMSLPTSYACSISPIHDHDRPLLRSVTHASENEDPRGVVTEMRAALDALAQLVDTALHELPEGSGDSVRSDHAEELRAFMREWTQTTPPVLVVGEVRFRLGPEYARPLLCALVELEAFDEVDAWYPELVSPGVDAGVDALRVYIDLRRQTFRPAYLERLSWDAPELADLRPFAEQEWGAGW